MYIAKDIKHPVGGYYGTLRAQESLSCQSWRLTNYDKCCFNQYNQLPTQVKYS
jgi:hypothetical protein